MDLEAAWELAPTDADGESDSYVDGGGYTQTAKYSPLPPPSFVERGATSSNVQKLSLHTGQIQRPSKSGDGTFAEFDNDLHDRPDVRWNAENVRQLERVVQRNRQNTQDAAENETQAADRSDLYKGHNVLVRQHPKVQTITRRAAQHYFVYGPGIRGGETQKAVSGEVVPSLRAGLYGTNEGGNLHGRASSSVTKAAMGAESVTTSLRRDSHSRRPVANETGRAAAISGGRPFEAPRFGSMRSHAPPVPIRKLATATSASGGAVRADVPLNGSNDVRNNQGSRKNGSNVAHSLHAPGHLSSADSTEAPSAYQKGGTYSQSAVVPAHPLSADRTAARDAHYIQTAVFRRAVSSSITNPLGAGEQPSRSATEQQKGTATQSRSHPARNSTFDSTRTFRVGLANARDLIARGLSAAPGRTRPSDKKYSLAYAFGRGGGASVPHETSRYAHVALGGNDANDVSTRNERKGTVRNLLSSLRCAAARTVSDTTQYLQHHALQTGLAQVVLAPRTTARPLRDDSLSKSHTPLVTGPMQTSGLIGQERWNERREGMSGDVRPGPLGTAPHVHPALHYNGHR